MLRCVWLWTLCWCGGGALRCFVDASASLGPRHTNASTSVSCAPGCRYCLKWEEHSKDRLGTFWGCGCGEGKQFAEIKDCTAPGRFMLTDCEQTANTGYMWCCKGDLCNAATSNLAISISALLISLLLA